MLFYSTHFCVQSVHLTVTRSHLRKRRSLRINSPEQACHLGNRGIYDFYFYNIMVQLAENPREHTFLTNKRNGSYVASQKQLKFLISQFRKVNRTLRDSLQNFFMGEKRSNKEMQIS